MEKLELVLIDLQSAKITDTSYNDTTYIDKEITKNGMVVSGDIVFVDGWQFEINRSVPKIETSLGKGEKEETIGINITSTVTSDYVKANVVIEIIYEKEIEKIIINGEEIANIAEPEKQNGKNIYRIEKEEMNNTTYTVIAKDKEEKYNIASIKITDITEDMDIWNKQDMEMFRDKVNSGRTFEGRTARLMDNIDLEGSEESQWIPIANFGSNNKLFFKGTFEGNKHKVEGIYINSTNNFQGLFGRNDGVIQNIKICGNIISTGREIGGIVGRNENIILNCENNSYVKGYGNVGGITGNNMGNAQIKCCANKNEIYGSENVAGISAGNTGTIKECYNIGQIKSEITSVGGIVGYSAAGKIYNSYNIGKIQGRDIVGGINGAAGLQGRGTVLTYNCYNVASISGNRYVGQITGFPNVNGGTSRDINCYTTNVTAQLLNSGEFSENLWLDDETGINNGYPVLKWQVDLNK